MAVPIIVVEGDYLAAAGPIVIASIQGIAQVLVAAMWPAAAVAIIVLLRRPISSALTLLKSLKGMGWELTFGDETAIAEAALEQSVEATALPPGLLESGPVEGPEPQPRPSNEDAFEAPPIASQGGRPYGAGTYGSGSFDRLMTGGGNRRLQEVMDAWRVLNRQIIDLHDRRLGLKGARRPMDRIVGLKATGAISDEAAAAMTAIWRAKEAALHGSAPVDDEAERFIETALALAAHLGTLYSRT